MTTRDVRSTAFCVETQRVCCTHRRQVPKCEAPELPHGLAGTAWQTLTHMSLQWMSVLCQYCDSYGFCPKYWLQKCMNISIL